MSVDTVAPVRPRPVGTGRARIESPSALPASVEVWVKRPRASLRDGIRIRATTALVGLGVYIATPGLIFVFGYLHAPISLVALAGGAVFLWTIRRARGATRVDRGTLVRLGRGEVVAFLATGLGLATYTGALGVFRQTSDWYKHNSMLWDLTTLPWPVSYPSLGNPSLVYSFAVYLPAAAVGHLFGGSILAAHIFLVLWLAIGFIVLLAASAILLPARFRAVAAILALIGYGGADSLGSWITSQHLSTAVNGWWAGVVQYSSSSTAIRWVPQHAISGWAIGLAYVAAWRRADWGTVRIFAVICFFAALWSPFALIGAVPLGAVIVLRVFILGRKPPLRLVVSTAALGVVAVPGILFVLVPRGGQHLGVSTIPKSMLVLFVVLMIGAWAAAAFISTSDRWLLLAPVGFLIVLPLLTLGQYNDIVMRSSFPSLFVLTFAAISGVARQFPWTSKRSRAGAAALAAAVLLGAPTAQSELTLAVTTEPSNLAVTQPAQWDKTLPAFLVDSGAGPGSQIWIQYLSCLHGRPVAVLGLPECRFDPQQLIVPPSELVGAQEQADRDIQLAKGQRWAAAREKSRYHPDAERVALSIRQRQTAITSGS